MDRAHEHRPRTQISILIRHRWLGDQRHRLWRCTSNVPVLRQSPDFVCCGCGSVIRFEDVSNVRRFYGASLFPALAESLVTRLDLLHAELQLAAERKAAS